jgi:hypothetical protein
MKFRNYLESITGVDIYPVASLLIFFVFFAALIIWAVRVNKQYIHYMKDMPVDND